MVVSYSQFSENKFSDMKKSTIILFLIHIDVEAVPSQAPTLILRLLNTDPPLDPYSETIFRPYALVLVERILIINW